MIVLLSFSVAHADYIAPPLEEIIVEATSIADVTVTGRDEDGHVHITTNRLLSGYPPPLEITDVYLTCGGGPPAWLTEGTRYIVIFMEDALYEETTYFEVRGDQCDARNSAPDATERWRPCEELIAQLTPGVPHESRVYPFE